MGEKLIERTEAVWPRRIAIRSRETVLKRRMQASQEPVARRSPVGSKAVQLMGLGWLRRSPWREPSADLKSLTEQSQPTVAKVRPFGCTVQSLTAWLLWLLRTLILGKLWLVLVQKSGESIPSIRRTAWTIPCQRELPKRHQRRPRWPTYTIGFLHLDDD